MQFSDFRDQPELVRPRVTADDAMRIAADRWGLAGVVTELGSHQDRNFLIGDGGELAIRHLLKVSNPVFAVEELLAQNQAATAVAATGLGATTAHPSLAGDVVETVELDGQTLQVRVLTFVEGEPLTDAGVFDDDDAAALGSAAARVVEALAEVRHPGTQRITQWNLRIADEVVRMLLPFVADDARRDRVAATTADAAGRLASLAGELRIQTIHGDVTDDNVVRAHRPAGPTSDGAAITGIIDFGDVAESWLVAELAVACTAVLHHNPRDPLRVLDTIAAFHERVPLTDSEVAALWPLVQLRTAVLVVSGEQQVAVDPDNAYASENRAHEWLAFVTAESLPCATMEDLIRWRLGPQVAVPGAEALLVDLADATLVDLSTTSPLLDEGVWLDDGIEERLLLRDDSVTEWGVARLTRAQLRSGRGTATVPLGIDLRAAAGAELRAPFTGMLRRDGEDVVLAADGVELWLRGVSGVRLDSDGAGMIAAGDVLGAVSASGRLWIQLSRLGGARPPRFSVPTEARVWREVCPDPSALLGREQAPEQPAAADVLATRDAAFARTQEHYYSEPPRIERGWREHFVDTDGQTYVDMVNNVATVGHAHPRLVAAVARQWALQNTNSRFHYAAVADFSARLADLAPDGLDTVFLVNSGSEAVDLAIRLATIATARPTMLAMREAYHGWTIGSDAVSSSIGDNPRALETRPDWVRLIDAPNSFRGTHRGADSAGAYLTDLDAQLDALDADGTGARIAGVIAEAVYGNAGGVMLPDGYLAGVYERVRARGGLCIADEVQVGYGRLGQWFWGFEQQGVVPDIITIAKAMGNGHPLGAVITTRAIADAFAAEGSMFSSAGGSPVSCVVGSTVLDIMRDEELQHNAATVGEHLRSRLLELQGRHPLIGAVHGRGFYLGVELVLSRETLEPATEAAARICDELLEAGCIVQPTGDHKNILKIKPPMVITRQSVDFFVDALDRVLAGR